MTDPRIVAVAEAIAARRGVDDGTRRFLSYGGGTQSAALALMSAAGQLPRLDAAIFADTQGELPETYDYLIYVRSRLAAVDIPLITVTAGSLEAALLNPVPTSSNPTPPAHVVNPDGSKGRINAYRCSFDFKRRLIERTTKRLCGPRGAWKRATVEQWIGFSTEELSRMRQTTECRCSHPANAHHLGAECAKCICQTFERWQINRWPLVEMRMRRADTIAWFARNGHPTPPRSACWFCPNSGNARWRDLRDRRPELWERAVSLDAHIRHGGGFNARGNVAFAGTMFLHRDRVPLDQVDLRSPIERNRDLGQDTLFDEDSVSTECAGGVCFT